MRLIAFMLASTLSILTACPRSQAPDAHRLGGKAAYPWEVPGSNLRAELEPSPASQDDIGMAAPGDTEIELPTRRGPAFATEDTLDESALPGQWLQVCVSSDEKLNIPHYSELDLLELRANGTMTWMIRSTGNEIKYMEGDWSKAGPGQLTMAIRDGGAVTLQSQLYGVNFLFIWDYNRKLGHWFARLPVDSSERVTRNRFDTTFGGMVFTEVGDLGFRGIVQGEYERTIGGLYMSGVITMRWEENATRSGGYAAFIVSPDFSKLDGVWWLDDYEASPFGGAWTGVADDSIKLPTETGTVEKELPETGV